MMEPQRNGTLDAARGLGILLVVAAHTLIPPIRGGSAQIQGAWDIVYSFHMALFFVIAGWSFELSRAAKPQCSGLQYAVDRARRLLLPYLTYSLLVYALIDCAHLIPVARRVLSENGMPFQTFQDACKGILLVRDNIGTHLWFLPRMFLVSVASKLLGAHPKRWYGLLIAFALSCVPERDYLCWVIRTFGAYMLYYNVGRRLYERQRTVEGRPLLSMALFGAAFVGLWLFKPFVLAAAANAEQTISYMVNGLFATLLALAGSGAVLSLGAASQGTSWLKRLGRAAFPVYLLHQPFLTTGVAAAAFLLLRWPVWACVAVAGVTGLAVPLLIDRHGLRKSRALSFLLLGERIEWSIRWKRKDA